MIIDKKGKVFGKINIIDLIVVIVVVAAIVVGLYIQLTKQQIIDDGTHSDTIVMKFYAEEVNDFVADKVKVGSLLYDDGTSLPLGKVTAVETAEPIGWGINENGEYVKSAREGYKSIMITGEVNGTSGDYGVEVNHVKYGVGHSMTLRAGEAKIFLKVYDMSVKKQG